MPPLALDQPCEPPEVFQFRRFQTARAISKNVRRLLAARSRPGRATPADLLVETLIAQSDVSAIPAQDILHHDQFVPRVEHLVEIRRYAERRERSVN